MRRSISALFLVSLCAAQPTVAPTNGALGTPRGQDVDGYNIVNSFETGYRFRDVNGNLGKYRSDVNFGNGLRLLGSSFSVHSKEGQGKYFDELLLNTQGLGHDPYQFSSFRLQKNRLYRYDMLWRLNDYFNPALPLAAGQHFMNTTRTMQDHSLVLLPQSSFRVFLGYSRVNQNGPGLSTANLFDVQGSEFPLLMNVRRLQNEFRLGFQMTVAGAQVTIMRDWQGFRDDTRRDSGPQSGPEATVVDQFRRDEPYHGTTRGWRGNLLWDRSKLITFNGRFSYAGTRRNFIFDEAATGADRFGGARNRQILVFGNGRRPLTTAAFTLNLFPSESVTIANHTAFHHTRMDGDGAYSELNNATLGLSLLRFGFLGIRTLTNSTDVNYRPGRVLGFFGGYQYATRRIRSVEQVTFDGTPERVAAEQENTLHTGRAGVRIQPVRPLSILFDAEIGRADRPVFPISDRNFHALAVRVRYKAGNLMISGLARTNYNFNSASLVSHSSRSRNYSADLSWAVRPWLSLDANYSKLHLDTLTGIAYFFNQELIRSDRSTYISNIHTGYLGARIGIGSRADLFVAYSRIQDRGDGSGPGPATPWAPGATPAVVAPGDLGYQTYPLVFDSPLARLSVRVHSRLRWNIGYQHYRYREDLLPVQNYRAHTGFTSLSWSF